MAGAAGGLVGAWLSRRAAEPQEALPKSLTCRAEWLRQAPLPGAKPRLLLLATGSVGSVKVPELACKLSERCDVVVVLTKAAEVMVRRVACRYALEKVREFEQKEAAGSLRVLTDEDEWQGYEDLTRDIVVHIELRKWADVLLIAPCSCNTMGKAALGLCDNLASCLIRAWDPAKPMLVAPAMNTAMWEHPCNAEHLTKLVSRGATVVPPASKRLACGDVGRGALALVTEIVAAVDAACVGLEERRRVSAQHEIAGSWARHGFPEWSPAGGWSK